MTVGLIQVRGGDFVPPAGTDFPGFPGGNNQVGHLNAPGWPGDFTNTAQGYPTPVAIGNGAGGTLLLANNATYNFLDIYPGADNENVLSVTGAVGGAAVSNVTFNGCRFTAAAPAKIANINQYTTGSAPLTFNYCTISPPPSLSPTPIPARAWPSSGVGQGTTPTNNPAYQTPYINSARDGINVNIPPGTTIRLDHCDIWGVAAFVCLSGGQWTAVGDTPATVNGQLEVVDCWCHDNRLSICPPWSSGTNYSIGTRASGLTTFNNFIALAASGPSFGGAEDPEAFLGRWSQFATFDHSNGIMNVNSNGAGNILVDHCVISGQGNTDATNFGQNYTLGTFWQSGFHYQFTGWFFYSGQPFANDTITLNGTVVTYVASGATGNQINIGANLAATLNNTTTFLNGSANAQISKATYTNNGTNEVDLFIKDSAGDQTGYTLAVANNTAGPGNQHLSSSTFMNQPQAGAIDGFMYRLLTGNTGVNPTGNLNPTVWQQFGFNGHRNITVKRSWISGAWGGGVINAGIGNSGQINIKYEDNVFSNDVMWSTRLCAVTATLNAGPYSPTFEALFNGLNGNSWRRNTYNSYPGSIAWDANYNKGGQYVWPGDGAGGGTKIDPNDWGNS